MKKNILSVIGVLFVLSMAGFESALFDGSFNGVV
jgi:hypothetical protein